MKPIVDDIAKRLRDSLKESIDEFEGLYVFGSHVRGDATDDSDVDIVVLFKNGNSDLSNEFYDIIFQIDIDYYDTVDIDILPLSKEQLAMNYFFYDEVVNKGIFYGA